MIGLSGLEGGGQSPLSPLTTGLMTYCTDTSLGHLFGERPYCTLRPPSSCPTGSRVSGGPRTSGQRNTQHSDLAVMGD